MCLTDIRVFFLPSPIFPFPPSPPSLSSPSPSPPSLLSHNQTNELLQVQQKSTTLATELKNLRISVAVDLQHSTDLNNRKEQDLDITKRQLTSLQNAYDALLRPRRGHHTSFPASVPSRGGGAGAGSPANNTSISSLRSQLQNALQRNDALESKLFLNLCFLFYIYIKYLLLSNLTYINFIMDTLDFLFFLLFLFYKT